MAGKVVVISLLLLGFASICVLGKGGKYEKDMNMNRVEEMRKRAGGDMFGKEFRSRKVMQVWDKAHRMEMPQKKLQELHAQLMRHDADLWKAKKERTARSPSREDNMASRDDTDETLDKQLTDTMRRFGMVGGGVNNRSNRKFVPTENEPFSDRKVNQLWIKAQKSNLFNEEELDELKKELASHQENLDEFNEMMESVHGKDGTKTNSVNRFDGKSPDDMRNMRAQEMELKLKHRDLSRDYQRLSAKMTPEEERGPFTEHRVITLWREARKQNFTEDELASIMEELMAFEGKILKHDDVQRQALKAEMELHVAPHERGPIDKSGGMKHKSLRERAREMGESVHNTMKELRHRISQGSRVQEEL